MEVDYNEEFPEKDKSRKKRIISKKNHEKRMKRLAHEHRSMFGPYIDRKTGRVKNADRGTNSKYIKKTGNRKLRRLKALLPRGMFKRTKYYDYWWDLW